MAKRGVSLAIVDARTEKAWLTVAGLTVAGRLVRTLEAEGVREVVVLSEHQPSQRQLACRHSETRVQVRPLPIDAPVAKALEPRTGDVLYVLGNLVVDRRLIRLLLDAERPTVVRPLPLEGEAAARSVALGRLPLEALDPVALESADADCIDPASLPVFSEQMRGPAPILLRQVTGHRSARDASRAVIKATQKHVMDAPARWLDPIFENAIVSLLAPTSITPNHVTYVCTALGFVAAAALLHGMFLLAFPLMYLVEWLDGVDGKLARTRLEYSTVGEWESYFDFAYENAWWFALTIWFHASSGDPTLALCAGIALLGGNLLDEIAYTLGHRWLGTALDLLSQKDAAFRLVAGRRNVYTAILLLGCLGGVSLGGFVVAGGWAVVTGCAHSVRLLVALIDRRRKGLRLPA